MGDTDSMVQKTSKRWEKHPLEKVLSGPTLDEVIVHLMECASKNEYKPLPEAKIDKAHEEFDQAYFHMEGQARKLATQLAMYFFGKGLNTYRIEMVRRSHVHDGKPLTEDQEDLEKIPGIKVLSPFIIEERIDITNMGDQLQETSDEELSFMRSPHNTSVGRILMPQNTYYLYTPINKNGLHTEVNSIGQRFKAKGKIAEKLGDSIVGLDRMLDKMQHVAPKEKGKIVVPDYGIVDPTGFRFVTEDEASCYEVLECMKERDGIKLLEDSVKDYIKHPKIKDDTDATAVYQSIHATIASENNRHLMEAQIRDEAMHKIAETHPKVSHDKRYEKEKQRLRKELEMTDPNYRPMMETLSKIMHTRSRAIRF